MTETVPWPRQARMTGFRFGLANQLRGRETAISGAESIIPSLSAHWRASVSFAILPGDPEVEWQAFLARMEGGLGVTRVPFDMVGPAADARGRHPGNAGSPGFSTFEHWSFVTQPETIIVLASDAALRETDLDLDLVNSLGIRPGQGFSIGGRFHRVQNAWMDGAMHKIRIQPPLRTACPAGTPLETANPSCLMRVVGDDEGEIDLAPPRVAFVTVQFREAF